MAGRNSCKLSKKVETRQKNIPAFQKYFREVMYSQASSMPGFSVKRRTSKAWARPACAATSPSFDISVTGLWARGRHADDHEISGSSSELQSAAHQIAIGLHVGNVTVRGKDGHQRIAMLALHVQRCEADGRRGIAPGRLGENMRRGHAAHFLANAGGLLDVRDRPHIFQRDHRLEPRDRFAQHCVAPGDIQ